MKHLLPFITHVKQNSSRLSQRSKQHVKALPKDLNSGFVDWSRLSQVPELNTPTPLSSTAWFCPIGTSWHIFFHCGYDINDISKIWNCGQAWLNSRDSNGRSFRYCGYCICRFGWSQLSSSTSCDVQTCSALSALSCCIKDFLKVVLGY